MVEAVGVELSTPIEDTEYTLFWHHAWTRPALFLNLRVICGRCLLARFHYFNRDKSDALSPRWTIENASGMRTATISPVSISTHTFTGGSVGCPGSAISVNVYS